MTQSGIEELLLILAKTSRSSTLNVVKTAATFGLSGIVGAAAKAAELLRHLHRKLHEASMCRTAK